MARLERRTELKDGSRSGEIEKLSEEVAKLNRTALTVSSRSEEIAKLSGEIARLKETAGYFALKGTCYKIFKIPKTFSKATRICGQDGGTLAMPRDAETNDLLLNSHQTRSIKWIGLHDQREEGEFEWVDGSALG
ncbi:PREDICTED: C-type lectin domain family 3 member A homolog, partial [Branchiostoma belcheri]|uniref:C-type lectin domain family 3 member A homolog n=1 Tax=Branchiostoma belcheri TaxID=7741 RepID=A0A6P4XWQ9_BRABE